MARTEEEVSTANQRGGADDADRLATDFGKPEAAPARKRRAPFFVQFYRSDIGKKWVMAVTGIVLMGYVFAHMVGALKVFLGPNAINNYGEWLRTLGEPALPRSVVLNDAAEPNNTVNAGPSENRALSLPDQSGP